ncbi:MAG TPA: homoserine kinase [Candidatus Aquilonibacter sp.]|nr:homoserine kinase [Candidatus Aquilonibacter sp.]
MLRNAFVVSVPATSANVGPGFDAVGIALSLRVTAYVRPASRFSLDIGGPHLPTHGGYEHAIRRAILHRSKRLPPVAIVVHNPIPLGKGLGSSAAAAVLGLAIAQRCARGRVDRRELARDAARLEGHADNAFAAVYGGAVIATAASSIALRAPSDLRALVVVPEVAFPTSAARRLLPDSYTRSDAAFTAGHASLLGAALATGNWRVLGDAMRDRLHQPYRARAIPGLERALAVSMPGLVGIALSGAGPSVFAFVRDGAHTGVAKAISRRFSDAGVASNVLHLSFAADGARVRRA